jgi:hypothetical protein
MAITPNTDFSVGQVLTAAQANYWPRGIFTYNEVTASDSFTVEEVQITSSSFTAVANRYYKITYFEPNLNNTVDANTTMRVRLTNLTGTLLGATYAFTRAGSFSSTGILVVYTTFTAGSKTVVATTQSTVGTTTATRDANFRAFLSIEDVGTA